ncbi:MAG: hypothetical protein KH366_06920 [Clostridiaceae bacterium]|nr:hypothetical protein [Clostridiaceae bacterium]
MPYCPKCDMEFIDGITVCSDCGGPLVPSREEALKQKKQQQEEEEARLKAEYEAASELLSSPEGEEMKQSAQAAPAKVYVKKADKYEDLKSSASAFILVGGCLLVFSVLCWTGIINLPIAGTSKLLMQAVLTAMGIGSIAVAVNSYRSAKAVQSQIEEENTATKQLIEWFITSYTADSLDRQLSDELGELGPEELSLKRFELIQDIIITNHDITDQSYVDSISEDIYSKLFES